MEKKFIKTTDTETANKLIAYGFKLVLQDGNVYTFINDVPKNFNFGSIDTKKIVYNNIIGL